jgi:5-methylcytosine-specific restriction enzyme A
MGKIRTLGTRVATAGSKLAVSGRAGSTKRMRGNAWMKRRAKWLAAHPLCEPCRKNGYVTLAEQVDHVVPLVNGGRDHESNFQSICVECHKQKSSTEAAEGWGV